MGCEGKVDLRCTGKNFAPCINYEGDLPDFSTLTLGCTNLEATTEEIYTKTQELINLLDLSTLTSSCVTLPTNKTVLNVLQALLTFICSQNTTITTLQTTMSQMQTEIQELQDNPCQ